MQVIIREMKNAIKEIKGIHTDSVEIIKFVLVFFNILVIAGAAVIFFPEISGNGLAAAAAADSILETACRTLAVGVFGALLIDLTARRNHAG